MKLFFPLFLWIAPCVTLATPTTMPSSEWRARMAKALPQEMCDPKGHVVNCYQVDQDRCRRMARVEFKACAKGLKMPRKIDPFADGIQVAYRAGSCVGLALDKKLPKKSPQDPKCQSAQDWNLE